MLSLPRTALLAIALGTAGVSATFAQTTTTPTSTDASTPAPAACTKGKHHHKAALSADEKAQLKKAYASAVAADPSLQTDKQNLKQQFEKLKGEGTAATKDDWKALHDQARTFHQKLKTAELAQDSTLASVFAKLEAGKHHHGRHSADSAEAPSQT